MDLPKKMGGGFLCAVVIQGLGADLSVAMENERRVAIVDLLEDNVFILKGEGLAPGPYHLTLSLQGGRLFFDVKTKDLEPCRVFGLSTGALRRLIKDYFIICNRYYDALPTTPPHRLETLDMARRALHNEASTFLCGRLEGFVEVDFTTARRLFTLVALLHWRGGGG